MSDTQYLGEGLSVGTYVGPARDDGGRRLRFQLTNHLSDTGDYLNLTFEQMCALRRWMVGDEWPTVRDDA